MRWLVDLCSRWTAPEQIEAPKSLPVRLSKNFTLAEFTRSGTAKRRGIDNTPTHAQAMAMMALCKSVLQPLRNALGPISVTSGFRSAKLNKAIGGARRSHHTRGMAADIVPTHGMSLEQMGKWIQTNCKFTQLIYEFGEWLHVSYDPDDLRNQVLEAYRDSRGKTKYRIYRFK